MVVTVFRSRMRPGVEAEMEKLGARMYELASQMPGFVSYKDYMAEDQEIVTIVEFETMDAVVAWREHPEHKAAQDRGRNELFSWYHIQVCETVRDYDFNA